jgi:branched-chain amino acid transport system substrate-binding protein
MGKYLPSVGHSDLLNVFGPSIAATTVQVLKQCGDDLTRETWCGQAANLRRLELPMLLPGITINTSPTDFAPIKQVQMERFDGNDSSGSARSCAARSPDPAPDPVSAIAAASTLLW